MKTLINCITVIYTALLFSSCNQSKEESFKSEWSSKTRQTWIGPEYWANRLQDWQINKGRLECVCQDTTKPMRTVHLLTHRLTSDAGDMKMSVATGPLNPGDQIANNAATGFLIGAGPALEYRAAALIHHSPGPGGGLFAGINAAGKLFIKDFNNDNTLKIQESTLDLPSATRLTLSIKMDEENYMLNLEAVDISSNNTIGNIQYENMEKKLLVGNIALVSNPGSTGNPAGFWFKDWEVSGSKVNIDKSHTCGPIICSQHTLSEGIMKMTAQMMPVGEYQSQTVKLETKQGEKWKEKATANIIVPGYTATFRIENWPDNKDIDYRINYNYINTDQDTNVFYWQGKVRKNPVEKEKIVVAGFTGNHQLERPGIDAGSYVYDLSHIWFPHNDLVENLKKQNPDVLFFSGDQIYEAASPTYWKGSDMHLDYLYRWYLWCWEFRELTKDIPTICIPDDHDVFQGNLWGESGRKTDKDDKGGFVHPPEIVNMVQRTQCNHLPDPYDSGTIEQDITLYYTDMNYGNISFAILEDRKFKSGPNGKVPKTNSNRADHVIDENFDPETADLPGLKLLGDKQLEFLNKWAANWEQANMKIALSQTVFANMANHHGPNLSYLVADYDANGWPQTGRNKALDAIRRGHGFMLCGDQHLATLVKHGINDWDDAGWSFCVPSIANFYPRAWMPKEDPVEKIEGTAEYCGKYTDGFGNKVSVWAHTNPRDMGKKPKALHDRMPGYGILKLNKKDLTITIENWPRYADPEKDEQYEGWPKTISIEENYGRKAVAWLPEIQITGMENPVIQIINERNDRIEYTIRVNGTSWKPKVFETGTYTVKIGEPGTDNMETVENVQSVGENSEETLAVDF